MKSATTTPAQAELQSIESDMKKNSKEKTHSTSPPAEQVSFNPDAVYYSTETAAYLVDTGTFYRPYTRKTPVKNGIRRRLEAQGHSQGDCKELIEVCMETIELDQAVDWSGQLAGFPRGVAELNGRSFLVTQGYDIPNATPGACPLHREIIKQAFPITDSHLVFCGWLRDAVRAIRANMHQPAPMLVMAGERKAGKSLLAHIAQQAMGGRAANPMTAWTGKLPWNDNLLGSELLLIDDSVASTDPRARKAFGSRFKEAIYAGNVEINTRRKSSIELRPVWRVMVCCNETPENLSVIPPLEDGIEDKIILLKVSPVTLPLPAQTPEEKQEFQRALRDELPAFLHWIDQVKTPEHLSDNRSGVTAWQDTELLAAITELSPEQRMESLISLAMAKGFMGIDQGGKKWMSATEVQGVLQDRDSQTQQQAKTLLSYDANAGRYLSALIKKGSAYVSDKKTVHGISHYLMTRPSI